MSAVWARRGIAVGEPTAVPRDPGPCAVVVVDSQGVIRHWNEGARQLFGYESAEAEGSSLDLIVPDADRAWHARAYRRSMDAAATSVDGDAVLDRPIKCRDGAIRTFDARLVFMKDPRDRAVGAAMVFVRRDP